MRHCGVMGAQSNLHPKGVSWYEYLYACGQPLLLGWGHARSATGSAVPSYRVFFVMWPRRLVGARAQVECDVGAPQVNYRESISRAADIKYTHKKQSGGSGQFAEVAIKFEPGEPGTGFEFRSDIKGGTVPKEYIPGVTKARALCHPEP